MHGRCVRVCVVRGRGACVYRATCDVRRVTCGVVPVAPAASPHTQIASMRSTLLANYQILHDSMLKHHPEVFGEEGAEAFEAWRSQFAWATAVVSVRGIAATGGNGGK